MARRFHCNSRNMSNSQLRQRSWACAAIPPPVAQPNKQHWKRVSPFAYPSLSGKANSCALIRKPAKLPAAPNPADPNIALNFCPSDDLSFTLNVTEPDKMLRSNRRLNGSFEYVTSTHYSNEKVATIAIKSPSYLRFRLQGFLSSLNRFLHAQLKFEVLKS